VTAPEHPWKRRAEVVLGVAASAILLGMMLLTVVDVIARYAFNRPLRGAFEVTELLLLVLIFAGLPLVSLADEHAVMDFVDRVLLLAWLTWLKADRIWAYRDATDVLRIVYGPFVYFMALTLALAAIIHLYKVVERAAGRRGAGAPPSEASNP